MSLSNWELAEIMKCPSCFYADQDKLKKMKEYHDKEQWADCGKVLGSCTFPYKRRMIFRKGRPPKCIEYKEDLKK